MTTPEPTIDNIRDAILGANLISEIPEKKRTQEQCRQLDAAQEFLRDEAATVMDLIAKPIFDEILMTAEGDKECVNTWGYTLIGDGTLPPRVTHSALNGDELARLFWEVYSARNTIGGMYERTSALLENFEGALKKTAQICSAVWGFDKPTKAKDLFEAMIPLEVSQLMRTLRQYNEQFHRRAAMLDDAFDGLIQLKHVNLGVPPNPYRITEENTPNHSRPGEAPRRSNFRSTGGSRFPGGSRPGVTAE